MVRIKTQWNHIVFTIKFPWAENCELYKEIFLTKFKYIHHYASSRSAVWQGIRILTKSDFNSFGVFLGHPVV
jgi:hypothetical protein